MSTREHSIATWCKRFQIDLWKLHDRMKAGELILYEKRGEDEVNVTHPAMNKIKELISGRHAIQPRRSNGLGVAQEGWSIP